MRMKKKQCLGVAHRKDDWKSVYFHLLPTYTFINLLQNMLLVRKAKVLDSDTTRYLFSELVAVWARRHQACDM